MKRFYSSFLALCLVVTSLSLFAQIPDGYYRRAEGKTGDELKVALHDIIKGHHSVGYGGVLDAYPYTDCKPNGKIWDMYSNYEYPLSKTCGSYDGEGDCYNREHTWPQSWFDEQTTPRCDLFHVVPTDGYVNNRRGNLPYGEVTRPTYTSGNGSKIGPCTTPGYSGTVFEPIDEYKGDIARGLLYMSVRYYGEDSGWRSSGMTNKSVILPWAMTMLLRWSDEDPVSQKEINRNNAVYGFQHNRNPFIDNPEYAHMIWDDNWHGTTYAVACNPTSHGSISATPTSAYAGQTITLTAVPEAGYVIDSWDAIDASNHHLNINNGQFIMPSSNVTVTGVFVENNTQYTISINQPNHGTISVSPTTAQSGQTVTLNITPDAGYSLRSWFVNENATGNSVTVTGNQFVMPAANVTVSASLSGGSTSVFYKKVTEPLSDWSGDYLIVVYEPGNKAFNGSLTTLDVSNNYVSVTISNDTIESSPTVDAATFTIAKSGDNYTIKSNSGYYIGNNSNNNALSSSLTEAFTNTITLSNDSANIVGSGGAHLRFNNADDQQRFRYYKSSTYTKQKAIQLYRRNEAITIETHTIQFHGNGGSSSAGDPYSQTVEDGTPTALMPNSFTRQGFRFDGWNTLNGGSYYEDEALVTLYDDLDLYASWDALYSITCGTVQHGTIHADKLEAVEDETVTLTAEPANGYYFGHWIVTDNGGNTIYVADNQFSMPPYPVTVSATFVPGLNIHAYVKVTEDLDDWTGNYLIVYETGNLAFDGSRTTLDAAKNTISVSISNDTIEYNNATCASSFNIVDNDGVCTIQSASGYYIGATSDSNSLNSSTTTAYTNTINYRDGVINVIGSGGAYLRFNKESIQNRFRYYRTSSYSSQQPIQLYKYVEIAAPMTFVFTNVSGDNWSTLANWNTNCLPEMNSDVVINGTCALDVDASVASLTINDGCSLTVLSDKILEAEEVVSNQVGKFILEDGAQLYNDSENVQATVRKDITLFDANNMRWNLIASPTQGTPVSMATHDDYDLFAYLESEALWIYHLDGDNGFNTFADAQGYLYANGTTPTLSFTGTLRPSADPMDLNLSCQFMGDLNGFNLVGNPFPCNATLNCPYYKLDTDHATLVEGEGPIAPFEAVFVKVDELNPTVRFTRAYSLRSE